MSEKIQFKDLSTWLQVVIVWAFFQMGLTALMLFIYAIIGMTAFN